ISASCGIEVSSIIEYKPILDEAIKKCTHKPTTCLIWQRPQYSGYKLSATCAKCRACKGCNPLTPLIKIN
ncbi:hypothetical protein VWN77_10270, partial [Campylobacter coli]